MSPISEARKKANEKYIKEKTDEIKVRVQKGSKEVLQKTATSVGESLNTYIKTAVTERYKANTGKDIEL